MGNVGNATKEEALHKLSVKKIAVKDLVPYAHNARVHSAEQIGTIKASIEEFGFNDPVGVWTNPSGELEIVEGHGRVLAAEQLGMGDVPTINLDHLTDEQRRAYAIVHNQTTDNSVFDGAVLQFELENLDFDWGEFGIDFEAFEPSFGDAEEEPAPDEGVTVKVRFHDRSVYQDYRQCFQDMEGDGASVSIS